MNELMDVITHKREEKGKSIRKPEIKCTWIFTYSSEETYHSEAVSFPQVWLQTFLSRSTTSTCTSATGCMETSGSMISQTLRILN